ncbi:hypothetical protein DAPPUDRAFT_243862 [Daphnia pulex]|uniref:Uncharacterized protein n=1 Tax=Daphnia pulex TaxID=6669 RepID=E9GJP6_DAPPU|nr:hypothetical protein DAPPUDRAFT_270797 [Daphnia pulex]EFX80283.1 hypothetical protein DAPPUDRAFT_243862 [Daphnia pulex]|eukprot:EFX62218.1 hypothetical protein DAPPUDRAFT_270797 [Daphnia pulex]
MELFDLGTIEALVKHCEIISEEDVQLTKTAYLFHNHLRSEFANFTIVALGQRQQIVQEIPNTLSFVVQQYNFRLELWARRFFYTPLFFLDMAH